MNGTLSVPVEVASSEPTPADYPYELERELVLEGGTGVGVRPVRPADAARLSELYERLSHMTAYQRFFTVMKRLPPDWARRFASVDYRRRLALVAEHDAGGGPELIAVARYEPADEPDTAEIALVVQDAWQGKGLGTELLHSLLEAAEARGVHRFCAYVLADNRRMLRLLSRETDVERRTSEDGIVTIVFRRRASSPEKASWKWRRSAEPGTQ
jgi:acetyltransferase